MKRRARVHSPSTKSQRRPQRRMNQRMNQQQLEKHFAVLLLLLEHNFHKLLELKMPPRARR